MLSRAIDRAHDLPVAPTHVGHRRVAHISVWVSHLSRLYESRELTSQKILVWTRRAGVGQPEVIQKRLLGKWPASPRAWVKRLMRPGPKRRETWGARHPAFPYTACFARQTKPNATNAGSVCRKSVSGFNVTAP
jgi:hypothetical protein